MQIHGLQSAQAAQSIQQASSNKPAAAVTSPTASNAVIADQLDFSSEAQAIIQSQANSGAESDGIRTEKVAAIRQAIADGSYETSDKLSSALDKLLDTFA